MTTVIIAAIVTVGVVGVVLAALAVRLDRPPRGYRGGPTPPTVPNPGIREDGVRLADLQSPAAVVDRLVRERVVVTLKSGSAFSGVVTEADARYLVLRAVVSFQRTPEGGVVETPADGELFLAVADVDYVQRP